MYVTKLFIERIDGNLRETLFRHEFYDSYEEAIASISEISRDPNMFSDVKENERLILVVYITAESKKLINHYIYNNSRIRSCKMELEECDRIIIKNKVYEEDEDDQYACHDFDY